MVSRMRKSSCPPNRIDTLARLFPDCVTETLCETTGELTWAIDFDQLRQTLSDHIVDGPRERYRLEWPGKRAAVLAAHTPAMRTLRPCRAGSIDFDTTHNVFIEGDNLETLKLLQQTHANRVQVIFIDPPYNSGKAWSYQDTFRISPTAWALAADSDVSPAEAAEGRFHAAWLNMMYPRLKLAWSLLADDGLLGVAINDQEVLQLGKILDEIFGPAQRLACAPWLSEASGGKEKSGLRCGHEYILLYVKRHRHGISQAPRTGEPLKLRDAQGAYRKGRELMKWGGTSLRGDRPRQHYALVAPSGEEVLPYRHDGQAGHWRWGKDNPRMLQALVQPDYFHWELRPFNPGVRVAGKTRRWVPYEKVRDTQKFIGWSTWLDGVGTNADATRELKALFGAKVFDTPKPTSLIRWIIGLHTSRDGIVLDFFAGSASTAHAVLQLNHADQGTRRFIMVQHAEACAPGSLAAQSGYRHIAALGCERVRRAGQAMRQGNTAATLDIGYRLLKIV